MTDDLVGRLRRWHGHRKELDAAIGDEPHPNTMLLSEAAARIEALEGENRAVRMMLADLHAATLTIATPKGSQLDEARDTAADYFAQPRVAQHLKQENAK